MPTLVLTPRFTEDSQTLWRAAIARGWNVERLAGWRVPAELRSVAEPVLYLEGLLGPAIAEQFGVRLAKPPDDRLPRLPEEYRSRRVRLTTLAEARTLREPAFVKPPAEKSLPARVYAPGELPSEYDDATPVLVAEPVRWSVEFRCFVVDRRLKTFSVYLRDGEPQRERGFPHAVDEAASLRAFVETLLGDRRVELPEAAVVDVGVIAGRGWAVVEQNAVWASGIYGCDPDEALDALRRASRRTTS